MDLLINIQRHSKSLQFLQFLLLQVLVYVYLRVQIYIQYLISHVFKLSLASGSVSHLLSRMAAR